MNILVKDKMHFIQMCAVRGALRLEIAGMKRSRSPSAYVIAKRDFGCTGTRRAVLEQIGRMIELEFQRQEEKYDNVHHIK